MSEHALVQLLDRHCAAAEPQLLDAAVRRALGDLRLRLGGPLRVAVAGRRGTGKSTLTNVVLQARLAATDLRECTSLVTEYSHGSVDAVHVVGRGGERVTVGLDPRGQVPAELPLPTERIDHLEVSVTRGALRGLTVVDTPGLATTDADRATRSERFLGLAPGEDAALLGAEAVVYVISRNARADDEQVLDSLRAALARTGGAAVSTVAVVNQVDRFGRRGDPWEAAHLVVDQLRARLGHTVAAVVPVVGALLETLLTGGLDHRMTCDLQRLAAAALTESDLASTEALKAAATGLLASRVDELVRALTLYGLQEGVAALRQDPALGDGRLRDLLLARAGHSELVAVLDQTLRRQAGALKAGWALGQVERLARTASPDDRVVLRSLVESFLSEPIAHQLRLGDVAQRVRTGALALPPQLQDDLRFLLHRTTDDKEPDMTDRELADRATTAMQRWAEFAVTAAGPEQARAASVVRRAFQLMLRDLYATSDGGRS